MKRIDTSALKHRKVEPSGAACQVRKILQARMRADLKVYADSIAVLQVSVGVDFEKAHRNAERARLAFVAAREKLSEHTASHGCAAISAGGSG